MDKASLGSKNIEAAYSSTLIPTIQVITSPGSLKNPLVNEEDSLSIICGALQNGQCESLVEISLRHLWQEMAGMCICVAWCEWSILSNLTGHGTCKQKKIATTGRGNLHTQFRIV